MAASRRKAEQSAGLVEADHELARWRGQMDERLDNVIQRLDRQHDDFKESEAAASLHRQGLREVISALSISVSTLSDSVKRIDPTVTGLATNRDQAQGFVWAARALWLMLGGMVVAAIAKLAGVHF